MKIRILDNADAVAELASATIARWLRETEGRASLGLAGGGSPRPTYLRLRDEDVDWQNVDIWLSD